MCSSCGLKDKEGKRHGQGELGRKRFEPLAERRKCEAGRGRPVAVPSKGENKPPTCIVRGMVGLPASTAPALRNPVLGGIQNAVIPFASKGSLIQATFFWDFRYRSPSLPTGLRHSQSAAASPLLSASSQSSPPHPHRRALRFDLLEGNPALLGTPPQRALPLSFQLPLRHFRPLLASLP
jgi:hypothetical protein